MDLTYTHTRCVIVEQAVCNVRGCASTGCAHSTEQLPASRKEAEGGREDMPE